MARSRLYILISLFLATALFGQTKVPIRNGGTNNNTFDPAKLVTYDGSKLLSSGLDTGLVFSAVQKGDSVTGIKYVTLKRLTDSLANHMMYGDSTWKYTSIKRLIDSLVAIRNDLKRKDDSTNTTSGYTTLYQNSLKANKATTLTMTGTVNQVIVTGGTQDLSSNRSWTFATPQDIATTSSPLFDGKLQIGVTGDTYDGYTANQNGSMVVGEYSPGLDAPGTYTLYKHWQDNDGQSSITQFGDTSVFKNHNGSSTFGIINTALTNSLIYADGSHNFTNLSDVATGQVLTSQGTGTIPAWSADPVVTTISADTFKAKTLTSSFFTKGGGSGTRGGRQIGMTVESGIGRYLLGVEADSDRWGALTGDSTDLNPQVNVDGELRVESDIWSDEMLGLTRSFNEPTTTLSANSTIGQKFIKVASTTGASKDHTVSFGWVSGSDYKEINYVSNDTIYLRYKLRFAHTAGDSVYIDRGRGAIAPLAGERWPGGKMYLGANQNATEASAKPETVEVANHTLLRHPQLSDGVVTVSSGNISSSASPSITGLTLTGLTKGSVPFIGTGGTFRESNSAFFWDSTNGYLGLGTATPGTQTTAGRRYLTLIGSTLSGVLELESNQADANGNAIGIMQGTDVNSVAADKRVVSTNFSLSGTTANNRGGKYVVNVKADGASGLNQALLLDQDRSATFGPTNIIVNSGNTARIDIDGTDGSTTAGTVSEYETGGDLHLTSRNDVTLDLDNDNNIGTAALRIRQNNSSTDRLVLQEDGTFTKVNSVNVPATEHWQYAPYADTVERTGQTATVAATNLNNTSTNGLYRVSVYLYPTTAGTSGTVTATIRWNDGAAESAVTGTHTFGALGTPVFINGQMCKVTNSTAITWETTVTSAVGNPVYVVEVFAERIF